MSSSNAFDLLGSESEGEGEGLKVELPKKEAKEKPAVKKAVAPPKPAAAPAPTPEVKRGGDGGGRGRGPAGPGRGGRGGGGRSDTAARPPAPDTADESGIDPVAVQQAKTVRGLRGGYGGPHAGRGPRRTDRQSTNAHEVEKRHGAGKGNWGTDADTIEEGQQEASKEAVEGVLSAPANEADAHVLGLDEEAKEKPAEEEKPAPEPEVIGLDEYEKLQAEKRAGLNKASKPVEVDMSGFKGMIRKEVSTGEEELEDKLELKNKKTYGNRKTGDYVKEVKAKEVLPHNFRVGDPAAPSFGGGRGGRGGPREGARSFSGRGEGGPRGPPREGGDRPYTPRQGNGEGREGTRPPTRPRGERYEGGRPEGGRGRGGRGASAPAIDDSSAFPSLG